MYCKHLVNVHRAKSEVFYELIPVLSNVSPIWHEVQRYVY